MSAETRTPTRKSAQSGVINFDGSLISYTSSHYGSFTFPLSEVAVIGEFTTDNGPYIDDWFLVFVPDRGRGWFEASMYAEGIDSMREQLSAALGSSIYGAGLFASTDFASRILWPAALGDRPLFTFSLVTASSFLRRLKLSILPEVSRSLSPDALSAMERNA